jgi:hypothetical protein
LFICCVVLPIDGLLKIEDRLIIIFVLKKNFVVAFLCDTVFLFPTFNRLCIFDQCEITYYFEQKKLYSRYQPLQNGVRMCVFIIGYFDQILFYFLSIKLVNDPTTYKTLFNMPHMFCFVRDLYLNVVVA